MKLDIKEIRCTKGRVAKLQLHFIVSVSFLNNMNLFCKHVASMRASNLIVRARGTQRAFTAIPQFTTLTDSQSTGFPSMAAAEGEKTTFDKEPRKCGDHLFEPIPFMEPFHVLIGRKPQYCTPQEAVSMIRSNDRVFVHGLLLIFHTEV